MDNLAQTCTTFVVWELAAEARSLNS